MGLGLQISYAGYTVLRLPSVMANAVAGGHRYVIYRPDGSECCHGVSWADVETAIDQDLQRRGAPPHGHQSTQESPQCAT